MARKDVDDFSDSDDFSDDLDLDDDDILDLDNDAHSYPARKRALEKSKVKGKGKVTDAAGPAKRGKAGKGGAEVSSSAAASCSARPFAYTVYASGRSRTRASHDGRAALNGAGTPSRRMRRAASRARSRHSSHEADGGGEQTLLSSSGIVSLAVAC